MKHILTMHSLLASLMVAQCCDLNAGGLSPVKGWRAIPLTVTASSRGETLSPMTEALDAAWQPDLGRSQWFAIRVPQGRRFLVTFTCTPPKSPVHAVLERSTDSRSGADGEWRTADVVKPGGRLDKFILKRDLGDWWRLRFTFRAKDEPAEFSVSDIALYSLDSAGHKDYWLTVGASIQAGSIRNSTFKEMVRARFPGYDPVMFNLAVSGWTSGKLRKALPGFLEEHPDASYVCIHIGGNNVTPKRPYPGGAEELREDLVAILRMIRDSGKTPILSRLSYRAYKGEKPVPPEENGSGPYVTHIYDPLIREYCPDFYDEARGRGAVDAYTWFKEHPDELSSDGIHVNSKGAESWNRLWAEEAGRVVYAEGR